MQERYQKKLSFLIFYNNLTWSKLPRLIYLDTISIGWVSLFVFYYSYVGKDNMAESKVNVLYDIEYIDTISDEISSEKSDCFSRIKIVLDNLKKQNLITSDEWYNALLFTREKLNLPYVK